MRQGILGGRDHMGLELHPPAGQRGRGRCQLQHGEGVVTLPNTQRNGLAAEPLLLFRLLVVIALPFGAGQNAAHLTGQVNARDLTKTQRLHEVVDGVHPHLVGQRVVIDVARQHDRADHVHRPQPRIAVAAKGMAAIAPRAGVVDDRAGAALAGGQSGHGHEGLVGRARRISAPQSPVEQGLVNRLVEHFPVIDIDAIDKQIGVKRGLADKRQHLARVGIQRHQGTTAATKQVFHHFLQLDVDRQNHVLTRCGQVAGQASGGPTAG